MEIVTDWSAGLVSAIGAMIYELSRWASLRTKNRLPLYLKRLHYWFGSLCFVAVGFLLGTFLGAPTILHALSIGMASQIVCSRVAAVSHEPTLGVASTRDEDLDTQTYGNRIRTWLES